MGTEERLARLGRYRVLALAHEGEQSRVYRCYDPALTRQLAVKVARPDAPNPARARRRLLLEARVRAAGLHRAVLPLYQLRHTVVGPALVGPWVPGTPLASRIGRGKPAPPSLAVALVEEIGGALDALHGAGWWHGDVSPANVLVGADGHLVLIDFGAARRLGRRPVDDRVLFTTPLVTAPEVWAKRPVRPQSDLYSLAVLLYAALVGRYPFAPDTPERLRDRHRGEEPAWPAGLDPAVRAVLARGLAKDPTARFASGAEMAAALRAALGARRSSDTGELAETASAFFAAPAREPPGEEALAATAARLEQFAAGLSEGERAALDALLRSARLATARATVASARVTMHLLAPAAALLALEACGAARRLADGPASAEELAARCAVPARPLRRLLAALAALGVLIPEGERYALTPALALAYTAPAGGGAVAGPIAQAAAFWAHLPRWVQTGAPYLSMDQPDGFLYAEVADTLDALHAEAAAELAGRLRAHGLVPPGAAILDIGAGSAVWSRAVAVSDPRAMVTAVDRVRVLAVARAYAEAAGMGHRFTAIGGDWRDAPLSNDAYDLAILANICHLADETEVPRLLGRAATALRPGGLIAVVDTIPDDSQGPQLEALLQALQLGLRTAGGGVYTVQQYHAWLAGVGCPVVATWPLAATGGRLTALLARRA
jgi:tRNA A-37 threonylcarbamoyl transferase component Bud32/ubiquinone/menaquinone biosynthesis C-methylase UbiE